MCWTVYEDELRPEVVDVAIEEPKRLPRYGHLLALSSRRDGRSWLVDDNRLPRPKSYQGTQHLFIQMTRYMLLTRKK